MRLSEIAGPGNMSDVTTQVVSWAIDNGRARELFEGARVRNSGNPALKGLEAKLGSLAPSPQQSEDAPPSTGTTSPSTGSSSDSGSNVGGDNISVGDISNATGVAIGRGNTVNVTNIYNPPQGNAPFPGQGSSSSGSSALEIWREKLDFLQRQEAITADAAQKFALKKQIEEAQAKIAELSS